MPRTGRDGAGDLVLLVAFGAVASLPLRGELGRHIVEATLLARRNRVLVEELQVEHAYASLAAANAELSLQATHDPLTGLADRAAFVEELASTRRTVRDGGGVLAVLYFDLDRFKSIDDSYGHAGGDDLLCQVAARIRPAVRGDGLLCRLGGDEFTAVLTGATRDEVLAVALRVRDCFATPSPSPATPSASPPAPAWPSTAPPSPPKPSSASPTPPSTAPSTSAATASRSTTPTAPTAPPAPTSRSTWTDSPPQDVMIHPRSRSHHDISEG